MGLILRVYYTFSLSNIDRRKSGDRSFKCSSTAKTCLHYFDYILILMGSFRKRGIALFLLIYSEMLTEFTVIFSFFCFRKIVNVYNKSVVIKILFKVVSTSTID